MEALGTMLAANASQPEDSGGLFPELTAADAWAPVLMQTALYGYVLFVAANMIGDGAELLLLVPAYAGVVGSIVLPILGAVPDGMMVLCSGLGPDAQEQVKVGVGALAGSTIMLLTLPWFLSIVAGRVNIDSSGKPTYKVASELKLSPPGNMSLTKTGVGLGLAISQNAKMMMFTATTYFIIQGPAFMVDTPDNTAEYQASVENPFAWGGLVACLLWFSYYLYQSASECDSPDTTHHDKIVQATVQSIQGGMISLRGAMAHFRKIAWDSHCSGLEQGLLKPWPGADVQVNKLCNILKPFYRKYDRNGDGFIDRTEFSCILNDLGETSVREDLIFQCADADQSGWISFEEFVACIVAFAMNSDDMMSDAPRKVLRVAEPKEAPQGEEGEEEEDMPEDLANLDPEEQQKRIKQRAFYNMGLGTVLVLIFSDPMCDMLSVIGLKISPAAPFYVSFAVAPLASNASELVSAMKLASKRTKKSMVNSLSTLEGAAIMNNTFCLGIFLVLIVWKGLLWQFSAETVAIVTIELLVGLMALKKVHRLLDGIIILLFYPMAVVIVYMLENFVGLD
mmetsp:Transcript_36673/g.80388  ORF Transcript_36673/g.80388 Transcript_36673/m.80388 type:complete len:566 (+) Transcript_36673:79-1776(+)